MGTISRGSLSAQGAAEYGGGTDRARIILLHRLGNINFSPLRMSVSSGAPPGAERGWGTVLVAASCAGTVLVLAATFLTHVVAPRVLTHYEHFPALAGVPKRTLNARHAPADPINVALVGTAAEVTTALRLARWARADAISRASDLAIAKSVLLNRADSTAPVSPLFLFGRAQDLAFEQQVGPSARRRHHVRLWQAAGMDFGGRPVWIGDATFDLRAGISHRGLHPTHHIAPDIDEERDALEAALADAGQLMATFRVTGLGVRVNDHNAEGDRFDTDGELRVMVLSPGNVPRPRPHDLGVPLVVSLKDRLWSWAHRVGHPAASDVSAPSN
jgi:hypothetical protein